MFSIRIPGGEMADIRPRKRARQARSRMTVEAIRVAAARILGEGGLDAVTTNAVAARAGVSVGSLYQYYPNRDAILADLLREKLAVLAEDVERAAALAPFERAVRAMLEALSRSYLERPALASALLYVEALVGADPEIAQLRARLGATVVAALRAKGVAAPEVAARDLVALSRGMALEAGRAGERDHAALLDRMARAVRGYLAG